MSPRLTSIMLQIQGVLIIIDPTEPPQNSREAGRGRGLMEGRSRARAGPWGGERWGCRAVQGLGLGELPPVAAAAYGMPAQPGSFLCPGDTQNPLLVPA